MSETRPEDHGETPTVAVRVFEHGDLIATELCETADEASALVASWEETPGIECEITDLSALGSDESSFEAGELDVDRSYPHVVDETR